MYQLATSLGLYIYWYIGDVHFFPFLGFFPPEEAIRLVAVCIIYLIFCKSVASSIYAVKYTIALTKQQAQEKLQHIQRENELKNNQLKRENELIKNQLVYFKNSFSPHLLFNAITFVKNKIDQTSEAYQAMGLISNVINYQLSTTANQQVPLYDEIKHIDDYLDLIFFAKPNLQIRVSIKGPIEEAFILPRVMLNYVENAVKHGVRSDENNPITVSIYVDKQVTFTVKNKKKNSKLPGTRSGNIMTNRALQLFYQDQYSLDILNDDDFYQVILKMPFDKDKTATIIERAVDVAI
ncbi:MAG: histidine kinase [Tunicatimonas sp.]|uniref:histidine kinase n=1 Tax=Tunicatimonas sp. TaxID=1940096 RepID=UPI003C734AFC